MGIGILKVAPDSLAGFIAVLPVTCTIVGSANFEKEVALKISSNLIPDGAELTVVMRCHGLSQVACVVIQE